MICEDAHWTDPTSLEAFGRAVDRIRSLCALLLVTFRPEFAPPWIGRPHVTALTLNRLTERDIAALIDHVVGNKQLPANIRQDIIERTDGIPLFVEEMAKAVLEAEDEGEARRTAAAIPSPVVAVPASLHASLLARLDRLGPAKEVAQIGAAIGREFSHALLAAVVRKPEAELNTALDRLVHAGLLFRQGVPPHASYLFKHALVQDAAYGTLLREPRRALHARIADTLETQFPEIAEIQPELLARHFTEAGLTEKAASLWGKAGYRSLTRSALAEAAEQLTRALAQIATLPGTPALRREEIKLQVALVNALMHGKGYSAPETKAAVEQARAFIDRAEAFGDTPEDPLVLFSVLYGFWAVNLLASNMDASLDLASQFLALATTQSSAPRMIAHRMMGHSLLHAGRFSEAQTHYAKGIALYVPTEHRPLATRFGQETKVAILSFRSWAHFFLGYPDAALACSDEAESYAREIGHTASLMFALACGQSTDALCGRYAAAGARIDELAALADQTNAFYWKVVARIFRGGLLTLTGNAADAISHFTSGFVAYRATGARLYEYAFLSNFATAYAAIGQMDDAWRCIGEAMAGIEATKERWWEAEVHRAGGEIALRSPEPDVVKAQAYFDRALVIARAQQAKSLELRAAISMARLWRDQGRRDEARALLAPVYGWFTEGFDTLDLKEAKSLLEELHA